MRIFWKTLTTAGLLLIGAPVTTLAEQPLQQEVRVVDLGRDGDGHYYRVYCPGIRENIVVQNINNKRVCTVPINGKSEICGHWSLDNAADIACGVTSRKK